MAHTAGSERVRDGTKINKSRDLPRAPGARGGSAGVIGPAVSPRGTQIPGLTHHAPRGRVVGPPIWGFSAVERLVRIPSYAAQIKLAFSYGQVLDPIYSIVFSTKVKALLCINR